MFLLRSRAGDYVRDMVGGVSAQEQIDAIERLPMARCNSDMCAVDIDRGGRRWRLLATRSPYFVPWSVMIRACAQADIIVSDRFLPRGCLPRWLKADRALLRTTGGLAIRLSGPDVWTVRQPGDDHPWMRISPASYPK